VLPGIFVKIKNRDLWLLPRQVFTRGKGKLENLLRVLSTIPFKKIKVQN
jgi:hypothetical protein